MKKLKREFKFSTFYLAYNGNNSVSDVTTYSVTDGLTTTTTSHHMITQVYLVSEKFRDLDTNQIFRTDSRMAENSFQTPTIGSKSRGFEYLFEFDYRRQQGREFESRPFLEIHVDKYVLKVEYLEDGTRILDISTSQRFRYKFNRKFSVNIGVFRELRTIWI